METENKESNQQNLLQLLKFRYFPYWPLFLALAILMLAAAWVYLKVTPAIYESSATILIKDEKKGVENSASLESLNVSSKKIVENEIEVIKSKTLMKETVEKLNLCASVYEDRLISDIDAYTSSPVIIEIKNPEKIKQVKRADFAYDDMRRKILFFNNEYSLDEWIQSPYGEIRFVVNPNVEEKGAGPFYFSLTDYRIVIDDLLKNLEVIPASKLSTVVNLSIKDRVPLRGNQILNTLLEYYNQAGLDDKNHLAANTLEFVEDRIRLVEHDLDSIEHVIQQFKSSKGVVDISAQGKLFLQNVGENDQKLSEINMQTAMLQQVEDYIVKNNSKSGIVTSTLGILDEALSGMVNKLYDAENQYQQLKNTTAENNPMVISLQNQILNMRKSILDYIRNQKNNLKASLTNLNSTNGKYFSILQTLPQKERQLLEVSRQQIVKNNVYTFLLQKKEETALTFASTVGDARLIDKAESIVKPVSPKPSIVFAGALVFAFLLVIIYVILKELLNSKILFRSEIESATKIPVVGEISHTGIKDHIVVANARKPFLAEQFRQLRSAVGLYGKSTKKILMVTSSISGEGKSFISANFATSLALSRKKVLLIDFDLRNPEITQMYNAEKNDGVAEYLLGIRKITELILKTEYPDLFLLGAGQEINNPFETLLNGNMEELFNSLKLEFDYIIVDTPPVDPVTDAFLLSPYCDATLFVIRHNKTPKTMIHLLDENNKVKVLKNVALVFNAVRSRGMIKNTYGYGYGYGNNYVYPERNRHLSHKRS